MVSRILRAAVDVSKLEVTSFLVRVKLCDFVDRLLCLPEETTKDRTEIYRGRTLIYFNLVKTLS